MGSVKYVEGPADIMRILRYNEYERSDVPYTSRKVSITMI